MNLLQHCHNFFLKFTFLDFITFRKNPGCYKDDLIQTDMMLKDFEGAVSPAQGAIFVDLTIGSKTLPTTFFVINGKGSYTTLLGRDWIHANCCIPSTMHQCIIQWIEDSMKVVHAYSAFSIATADPKVWSGLGMKCISGEAWEGEILKMADFKLDTIQEIGSKESSSTSTRMQIIADIVYCLQHKNMYKKGLQR